MFRGSDVGIGERRMQGIDDGLILRIVEMRVLKRVYTGGSKEAVYMVRILCRKRGLRAEISYGVNIVCELGVAKE